MRGDTLKLIALVLPLGLDTFGVALALGIAGLAPRGQVRVAVLFAGFETAMPLVGVALGVPLGHAVGGAAEYLASTALIALGLYMLLRNEASDQPSELLSMTQRGLIGAVALGLSISLDELAIGFSAGLLRLPLLPLVIAIGVQTFAVTLVGVRLGTHLGERWRESAEGAAGSALILLGTTLFVLRLTS